MGCILILKKGFGNVSTRYSWLETLPDRRENTLRRVDEIRTASRLGS
jgi:hypothetical protein